MGAWRNRLIGGTAVTGCLISGLALADTLVLDLSSTLTHDDNLDLSDSSPGGSTIWDTQVGATYTKETATSVLTLSGQGVLRFADLPSGSSTGVEDPQLGISFASDIAEDAQLTFDASHRRADLSFLDPLGSVDGDLNSTDLVRATGTRISNQATIGFVMDSGQGLSMRTSLSYSQTDYQGASDDDLFDSDTLSSSTVLGFDLSDTTQARLSLTGRLFEADNTEETERSTVQLGLGLTQALSPITTLDVSLGYTDVETRELSGTESVSGLTGGLSLTRELQNGTASAGLDLSRDASGERVRLQFGRAFETQTGSFDGSIGLSWNDNGDQSVIGQLAYREELRTGQFSVNLSRSVSFDDDDDQDITSTRASVAYRHDINALSHLNLSASMGLVEDSSDQTERHTLRASYSHDLTEDWTLTGGYEYRALEDEDGQAHSNAVFLTMTRQFEFRR